MAKNKYNKPCQFCVDEVKYIDYKNVPLLRKFISQYYKIIPRYYTGTCLKHQKAVALGVKNARTMALLAFHR